MKLKYLFLLTILFSGYYAVVAQTQTSTEQERIAREQAARDAEMRRTITQGFLRLAAIRAENQENIRLIRKNGDVSFKYKPALTKQDIEAVSINPADLTQFKEFLKQPDTGIVRLQNAGICLPESQVIQAVGTCPNNIVGKATGYSFRTNDYKNKIFSDIFFIKNAFSAPGVFTFGIFSNLGNVDIQTLTLASGSIKELADFQPPADESKIKEQVQILNKGIQIGDSIYRTQATAAENNTYVLRTIAYNGCIMRNSASQRINILNDDQRKDVLLVFRVVRKHEDGSLTLLYKELRRQTVPKVVLEEKK